jgi:hypothetical protein
MADKHPAPKDPSEANREHDETRRRLDGPALMIAIPLLLVAIYFAFTVSIADDQTLKRRKWGRQQPRPDRSDRSLPSHPKQSNCRISSRSCHRVRGLRLSRSIASSATRCA